MPIEISVALITGAASVFGTVIALAIGLRQIKVERERLKNEQLRYARELEIEKDKLNLEKEALLAQWRGIAETSKESRVKTATLRAEERKIALEMDEILRSRLESERDEIANLLTLFDRVFFLEKDLCEEPLGLYRALHQTRISLQKSGASRTRKPEIAKHFDAAKNILREVEFAIEKKYPRLIELVDSPIAKLPTMERKEKIDNELGEEARAAARMILDVRSKVRHEMVPVQRYLLELDIKLDANC